MLDSYHWHEALDRVVLLRGTLFYYLDDHAVAQQVPVIKAAVDRVAKSIDALEQEIIKQAPIYPKPVKP